MLPWEVCNRKSQDSGSKEAAVGGPKRGGGSSIYPRVDEGGTARSLYSLKDVALGSV